MRKKTTLILLLCLATCVLASGFVTPNRQVAAECPEYGSDEVIRVHIRANSNDESDQDVKYAVRDAVVEYLSQECSEAADKSAMETMLNERLEDICAVAEEVLFENGYTYGAHASLKEEYFPVRVYGDIVLKADDYEALIIELGSGEGDNWWCIAFPTLCFGQKDAPKKITYKSRIKEWWQGIFG